MATQADPRAPTHIDILGPHTSAQEETAWDIVTTQLHHDTMAYRTLPLNAHEKVAIINAVHIPRWTSRGLFLGNTSRMALWDDILLHCIRDTAGIEQQMNKQRLTTNLSHGGLGLRQLWWSYITRWITLKHQELQNRGPTQQITATQYGEAALICPPMDALHPLCGHNPPCEHTHLKTACPSSHLVPPPRSTQICMST